MISAENYTDLVGTTDATRITGYSATRLLQLANAGQLKCIRTTHGRLFDRHDLERLRNPRDARTVVEAR